MKNYSRKCRWTPAAILAAMTAMALSGCGASLKSQTAETNAAAMETYAAPMSPQEAGWAEYAAADSGAMGTGGQRNKNEMAEVPEEDAASGGDSTAQSQPAHTKRKLIRTVRLNVETEDFDGLLDSVTKKIEALGGYAEQSEVSGRRFDRNGEPVTRYASITVRVPSENLNAFVSGVEESGNVTNKSESVEDVTLQYSDVESRKKSLEIEQERIWALLEKADTLEAVIALEERLSEIRYELESMESRLRLYDNQVEYSTVYLTIDEVQENELTPTAPLSTAGRIQRGFSNNLAAMGNFLVSLFSMVIMLIPIWVPLVFIAYLCWWLVRRRISGKKQKNGPNGPETPENKLDKKK